MAKYQVTMRVSRKVKVISMEVSAGTALEAASIAETSVRSIDPKIDVCARRVEDETGEAIEPTAIPKGWSRVELTVVVKGTNAHDAAHQVSQLIQGQNMPTLNLVVHRQGAEAELVQLG